MSDKLNNKDLCQICKVHGPEFLTQFSPFIDVAWCFDIYQCKNCGVRYALRDRKINYHELLHSKRGTSYDGHYQLAENVSRLLKSNDIELCERFIKKSAYKYSLIIDFLKDRNSYDEDILEIGCSSGFLTAFLNALGYRVEGIDSSESAILYAEKTFGSYYNMQPKKKAYNVIFHLGLIGCVDNPPEFISKYLALLKPGGCMVFNAPNVESVNKLGELWVDTPPPDLIYLFSEDSIKRLCGAGYHVDLRKMYSKGEIIRKNIYRIFKIKYYHYPVNFFKNNEMHKHNKTISVFLFLKKVFWLSLNVLYYLKIFKYYSDDYGLIVTIRNTHPNR